MTASRCSHYSETTQAIATPRRRSKTLTIGSLHRPGNNSRWCTSAAACRPHSSNKTSNHSSHRTASWLPSQSRTPASKYLSWVSLRRKAAGNEEVLGQRVATRAGRAVEATRARLLGARSRYQIIDMCISRAIPRIYPECIAAMAAPKRVQ